MAGQTALVSLLFPIRIAQENNGMFVYFVNTFILSIFKFGCELYYKGILSVWLILTK